MSDAQPFAAAWAGACDCHVHVYEPGYPLAPTASFEPRPAPLVAYRQVQRRLGLSRVVVVQPTGYGFDNRCTLGALARMGEGARGVAVLDPSVDDQTLQHCHAAGIRGVRFMMLGGGVLPWDALEPVAARIEPLGWHIDLQLDGGDLAELSPRLERLPVPLVIDHVGKFLTPRQPRDPAFRALRALLDGGRCWVKLSAPYETSRAGPPAYEDVSMMARTLAHGHAERCLWGSNWPHPNRLPPPDDAALLALLQAWAPDSAACRRILVDNPAQLYGF